MFRARLFAPGLCAALLAAAPALARQPSGDGDPAETRCMVIDLTTGRLGSGTLCKTNAEWAQMKADGVVLDQFGDPIPQPDARDVANHGCKPLYGGGPSRDGTRPMRFDCH